MSTRHGNKTLGGPVLKLLHLMFCSPHYHNDQVSYCLWVAMIGEMKSIDRSLRLSATLILNRCSVCYHIVFCSQLSQILLSFVQPCMLYIEAMPTTPAPCAVLIFPLAVVDLQAFELACRYVCHCRQSSI